VGIGDRTRFKQVHAGIRMSLIKKIQLHLKNSYKTKETFMRDLSPRNGRYVSALNDFLSERKL
jgi:hypothetical protein